jgi:hypothetical protein
VERWRATGRESFPLAVVPFTEKSGVAREFAAFVRKSLLFASLHYDQNKRGKFGLAIIIREIVSLSDPTAPQSSIGAPTAGSGNS